MPFNNSCWETATHVSPTTILDFRLSYLRDTSFTGATGIPFDLSFTGWPAATIAQLGSNCCGPVIPRVAVSGFSVNGGGGQQIFVNEENYAISGSETKILGRHTLRFGGEFRRAPNNYGQTNSTNMEAFGFTNAFTGNPFASYLLGLPQTTETELALIPASTTYYGGVYFGDSFQATSRLVAQCRHSVGISRLLDGTARSPDRFSCRTRRNPLAGPTGLPLKGNVELVNTPAYPHRTNLLPHYDLFSPRLGIAYRATNSLGGPQRVRHPLCSNSQLAAGCPALSSSASTWHLRSSAPPPRRSILQQSFSRRSPAAGGQEQQLSERDSGRNRLPPTNRRSPRPTRSNGTWIWKRIWDTKPCWISPMSGTTESINNSPPGSMTMARAGPNSRSVSFHGFGPVDPVPNPFYGLITTGNLAGPTIPAGQLLRPYPQYFNLSNAANTAAGSNYNALQAKVEKRFPQGGTLLAYLHLGEGLRNS